VLESEYQKPRQLPAHLRRPETSEPPFSFTIRRAEPQDIPDATAENEAIIEAGAEQLGEIDGNDGIRGLLP
jgi:hypothetical protein